MLLEMIFKGRFAALDFSFLNEILKDARQIYFNFPASEKEEEGNYEAVVKIIESNTYIDLVINTDHLKLGEKIVSNVFVNVGRDEEEVELLYFLNLSDLNESTTKKGLDFLNQWMLGISKKYSFNYFICQFDNASEGEYYFDSYGFGKLYKAIE